MKHTTNRVAYLDGLRGLAAILVVVHHMMIGFYPSTYTGDPLTMHSGNQFEKIFHNTPLGVMINGGLAVAIFLVLSGYVIGLSTSKLGSIGGVIRNVGKRFFRFFLPILATHFIALALLSLGWHWNQEAAVVSGSNWWLGIMWQMEPSVIEAIKQAFLSLFRVYSLDQVYNSSTWTMPFFFLGPTVILIILAVFKKEWLRIAILTGLLIAYLKTHYWPIIPGYFLSKILPYGIKIPRVFQILLLMLTLVLANYPQAYNTASQSWLYSRLPIINFVHTSTFYHTLATVFGITLIVSSGRLQKILSVRPLQFLGKISFSLYLLHVLLINSVTSGLFLLLSDKLPYSMAFMITQLASWPMILGGSMLLFTLVEQPAVAVPTRVLQWGVWLSQGFTKKLNRI